MKHFTRFRAYQLGKNGASFSLRVDNHFTLGEAKLSNLNWRNITEEMRPLDSFNIDVLHITSWDIDHCDLRSLSALLKYGIVKCVEIPFYKPHTEESIKCLELLRNTHNLSIHLINTELVKYSINKSIPLRGKDVWYNPIVISNNHNDNSLAKLYRTGSFQILSLGDCESVDIDERMRSYEILQTEVDVLLLAHHGSANSICSMDFLKTIHPRIAICFSDYANQFGHPDDVVRKRLNNLGIPLYTTKTGDVIVESIDNESFKVYNYIANNSECKDVKTFLNKTYYVYG